MTDRPNIIFVITDQHRGTALGADPHCPTGADGTALLDTPNIDSFLDHGALFERAYSPAPTSTPARRCLWTGQTPATNGCPAGGSSAWEFEHTLADELRKAGYQTRLVGKTHSTPTRNHIGFEHIELHSGLQGVEDDGLDDYARWLEQQTGGDIDEEAGGLGRNGWDARPSHLPEHLHPTVWTTKRAIEFLELRDPTRPFFLTVSYVRPHQPYDPPRAQWERYIDRGLPEPHMGDWADDWYGDDLPQNPAPTAWCGDLPAETVHRARAGYYGCITQIDQQIHRLYRAADEWDDTLVVFTADHGDMLGDHYLWRKGYGLEGDARVPLVMKFHDGMAYDTGGRIDRPVGLEDLMPTVLEVAGAAVPDTVEGTSLLELLAEPDRDDWREYYHGEFGPPNYTPTNATQYLVDETTKYIWNPVTGEDLLFDLAADPGETEDLSDDPAHAGERDRWRSRLIDRLEGRQEGFTDGETLSTCTVEDWPEG